MESNHGRSSSSGHSSPPQTDTARSKAWAPFFASCSSEKKKVRFFLVDVTGSETELLADGVAGELRTARTPLPGCVRLTTWKSSPCSGLQPAKFNGSTE